MEASNSAAAAVRPEEDVCSGIAIVRGVAERFSLPIRFGVPPRNVHPYHKQRSHSGRADDTFPFARNPRPTSGRDNAFRPDLIPLK
jgi:hypothetical protein